MRLSLLLLLASAASGDTGLSVLTKSPLPGATVDRAYSLTLTASGGAMPYQWDLADGALPDGLALSPAGVLAGNPSGAGNYSFTLRATDAAGAVATSAATLVVGSPATIRIVNSVVSRTPIPGNACTPPASESEFLTTDPRVWVVFQFSGGKSGESGSLQWLNPNGEIYATATIGGDGCWYYFIAIAGYTPAQFPGDWRIRFVWNQGEAFSLPFHISTPPVGAVSILSSTVLPDATLGRPYSFTLTATGGSAPYAWSVPSGELPPGLSLSSAGILSGSPTRIGGYNFTVRVQDANSNSVSRGIGLGVGSPALSFSVGALTFNATAGNDNPPGQTVSVASTGAPLSFRASAATTSGGGWLSVTPNQGTTPATLAISVNSRSLAPGTYRGTVTVSSSDASPGSTALSVVLNVDEPVTPGQLRGIITTSIGADWVFPFSGLSAKDAPLGRISWVAVDLHGNPLFSDPDDNVVLRIRSDGGFETVAGNGFPGFSGDGGPATNSSLNNPGGIAVDQAGNIYICDSSNHRVRRISTDGIITTFAGTRAGFGGDGGPAVGALLNFPTALAIDSAGSLYISDQGNALIRKVTTSGIISTFAGNRKSGSTGDGGPATDASIEPNQLAFDAKGNLYFAEALNNKVRRITPDGVISTVAGTGVFARGGDGGPATSATLLNPAGVAFDPAGNLYISEFNGAAIRRVGTDGIITTFAGTGRFGLTPDGTPANQALFAGNWSIAVDPAGNLYVADRENMRIRIVDTARTVSTAAGNGKYRNADDGGSAFSAYVYHPRGIAFDPAGNLVVVDSDNERIRRIDTDGTFHTIAGSGILGVAVNGPALSSGFYGPVGVAVDRTGIVYVADTFSHRIRRIDLNGLITTVAGSGGFDGAFSGDNGPATSARLNRPHGLALDQTGNIYFADEMNHRIRRVDTNGVITTVVGTGTPGSTGDNGPATQAALHNPFAVAFDRTGNMYIAESQGHVVRKVDLGGIITTIAGNGKAASTGDSGPAISASLNAPAALVFDAAGNLYVGERDGNRVRRIDANGIITTVAGTGVHSFSGDGGLAARATLASPNGGLAIDAAGNLYISDTDNNRIRVVSASALTIQTSASSLSFRATSNGSVTDPQTLGLGGSLFGLPFSATVRTTSGGGWLRVSAASGIVPAALSITADPRNLAPGTYNGSITITAPNASPVTVAVSFTVADPNPPKLGYDPGQVTFTVAENGTAEQVLFVANRGGGSLMFNVGGAGDSWLTVAAINPIATTDTAGSARVAVNAAGLAPGTYTSKVTLSNPAASETASVDVILAVTPAGRSKMLLSQAGLYFRGTAGNNPYSQCFAVLNVGQGNLDFTLSTSASWINASKQACPYRAVSSSTPIPEVVVDINSNGMAAGDYEGQVQVASPGSDNSPQILTVKLKILPSGTPLGPELFPTGVVFSGAVGGSTPGSLGINVVNLSDKSFDYFSSPTFESSNWFAYQPSSGNIRSFLQGSPFATLTVQPDTRGLRAGLYYAFITIGTREYGARVANALLVLTGGAGGASAGRAAAGCPGNITLLYTLGSQDFTATAGQPFPLEVYAADSCGAPLTRGTLVATFSNGDPSISMIPLGDGRWTATWTPTRGAGSPVSITVRGSDGNAQGQSAPLGGSVQ
jgi:sugar lactone lactonase YvrE